jgi:hypothetical protein
MLESDENLEAVFLFSKNPECSSLQCTLRIREETTSLCVSIKNNKGRTLAESSSRFTTGFERDEFLSTLRSEMSKATYRISQTLCKEE